MTSLAELNKWIDKAVSIKLDSGLIINGTVVDAKVSYGKVRLLVRPETGRGEAWVDINRVVEK